jgi:hypothetical protein
MASQPSPVLSEVGERRVVERRADALGAEDAGVCALRGVSLLAQRPHLRGSQPTMSRLLQVHAACSHSILALLADEGAVAVAYQMTGS